jgi:gamma-glutamyltranspeptidase/glutathione hydrolase
MAATSHPLSTLTAVRVLQAGGNAMDAAVAACAVQCVVEPGSTGIGGDCFTLYAPGGRAADLVAYNGSGTAPAAATAAWYRERGVTAIERTSPHAVTVPGAVEAWSRLLEDHGTLSLSDALRPAIRLARDGYPIAPRVHHDWTAQAAILAGDPNARRIFLPGGAVPAMGSLHRQPELADTLELIADRGPAAFYEGPVAADMVDRLAELGGLHTLADFAGYRGEYVATLHAAFRGHDVYEVSGNGQGIIALMILNVLSRFEPGSDPLHVDRLHVETEATRLCYAIRDRYLADQHQGAPLPVKWMLSDALADELASRIDLRRALDPVPVLRATEHKDTVYIAVVDRDRNAASFINSLFYPFGSGIVGPRSGVMLHNRGQSFVLEADHPNAIAPGKRPLHTIIPGMLAKDGRIAMPFGVMGGHYQAMGHAHLVSKVLDYGLDLQSAIDLPRLFPRPETGVLDVERPLRQVAGDELARRGFKVGAPATPIGGGQAIWIDWERGTLLGASDPRKDGSALGY